MKALRDNLRRCMVGGLLVGLLIAGSSTCPVAGAGCAPVPAQAAKCCCGPKCNGQCGAACCQTPAPAQDRKPTTPTSADEHSPAWGLPLASVTIAAPHAVLRHAFAHDPALAAGGETLLALSVRLNL